MEKVLVTGASGFIGQELANKLTSMHKYETHVLERYVTGRYRQDESGIKKHYATLTDYVAIKRIIKKLQPEYVIHLAAVSPVAFSYDNYLEVTETNYVGTINLAEVCFREVPNFKQFIMAGTSEEYGMSLNTRTKKLTEESSLHPNSPYAVAKVAADIYLNYMHEAYGFPCTILRPFNTYGRKDNDHFFIERTISQMLKNKQVTLGDPSAVRDWLYVDDHVDGYIKALGNKKVMGETVQLCTGSGYTTKETAQIIAKLTKFRGNIHWNATQKRPLDAKILIGDNKKAARLMNWRPQYTLEEGLKKTIAYWKNK